LLIAGQKMARRCRCSTACAPTFAGPPRSTTPAPPPEHFQRYILFTNYHRYVDEFVDWAWAARLARALHALSGAGGLYVDEAAEPCPQMVADTAWRRTRCRPIT
jgi:hypothetical protein